MEDEKKKSRWKKWLKTLTARYRLVLLNDETYEEVSSFLITRMNVYVLASTIIVLLVLITASAIIYTPLREYLPGNSDLNLQHQVMDLKLKSDSLETVMRAQQIYLVNLKSIINGDVPAGRFGDTSANAAHTYDSINLQRLSPAEKSLRHQIDDEQKFSINVSQTNASAPTGISSFHFFAPLKGYITAAFNPKENHYGIDIVAPENTPIMATLDGKVIYAGWSSETGYVLALQHSNNLISFYKHNSALLKQEGDYVKAGDVIAIIGNTGELSSGPHLHFEIWYNGLPLNPTDYIAFD
jgi:murein DD-endopeptidase MepM/ murein hydrolase activator NlpD